MNFKGKVAVVTGASSGIGYETALELGKRGARVVAVARRRERLEALKEQMPADCAIVPGDLEQRGFAQEFIGRVIQDHGRIDILVNNAALSKHKSIFELGPDEVERVLRVNFLAPAWAVLAALPQMLQQGEGYIVNVSSFAAKVTPARESVYAASKAALSQFTEGLWSDLAGSGVHAALVVPGPIDTEIWEKLDTPAAYGGRKYPASKVAHGILEAIEKRRFEVSVPARAPGLMAARTLRLLFPGLLRRAMARFEPVPESLREQARRPAKGGAEEPRS